MLVPAVGQYGGHVQLSMWAPLQVSYKSSPISSSWQPDGETFYRFPLHPLRQETLERIESSLGVQILTGNFKHAPALVPQAAFFLFFFFFQFIKGDSIWWESLSYDNPSYSGTGPLRGNQTSVDLFCTGERKTAKLAITIMSSIEHRMWWWTL